MRAKDAVAFASARRGGSGQYGIWLLMSCINLLDNGPRLARCPNPTILFGSHETTENPRIVLDWAVGDQDRIARLAN